jgi:hypothetical protein
VALALAIGVLLGGSAARLRPHSEAAGARAEDGLLLAMMAAPNTEVEPDPAPSEPPRPEVVAAAVVPSAPLGSPSKPEGSKASSTRKPPLLRATNPTNATHPSPHGSESTVDPPAQLPRAAEAAEAAPTPDPWPGARERRPPASVEQPDPRGSAPPGFVILIPLGLPRADWQRPMITVIR